MNESLGIAYRPYLFATPKTLKKREVDRAKRREARIVLYQGRVLLHQDVFTGIPINPPVI